MLTRSIAALGVLVMLTSALAGPPGTGKPPAGKPPKGGKPGGSDDGKAGDKGPKNRATRALRTLIDNAEFDKMPFEDFVEWLERTTEADVVVRWAVLEKAGIERDAPITLKKKNITIARLLPLVFEQVTQDVPEEQLAAHAEGNILLITTKADLNSKMIVRSYDVQSLLQSIPNFKGSTVNTDDIGRGGGGGGLRAGSTSAARGGGAGVSGGHSESDKPKDTTQQLIDTITQTIEPDSWKVNGGRGTISSFNGKLVIRNSLEVHQLITELLGEEPAAKGKP